MRWHYKHLVLKAAASEESPRNDALAMATYQVSLMQQSSTRHHDNTIKQSVAETVLYAGAK